MWEQAVTLLRSVVVARSRSRARMIGETDKRRLPVVKCQRRPTARMNKQVDGPRSQTPSP